jgi:hypothetical protein
MRITESTLRKIVREEIVNASVRSGTMSLREGRRLMESLLPDEIKSMGLKTGVDVGPTKFEKMKVYDLATDTTWKIVPTEITDTRITSTLVFARKSTGWEVISTYDEGSGMTTTELRGPTGVAAKQKTKGDLASTHGVHATFLRSDEALDDVKKKINAAGQAAQK